MYELWIGIELPGRRERAAHRALCRDLLPHDSTDIIRQQAMEAHMLKPKLLAAALEMRLPVRSQRERGMTTPDGMFPTVRESRARQGKIANELDGCHAAHRQSSRLLPTAAPRTLKDLGTHEPSVIQFTPR
jgi:hypothetical protein